MNKQILKQYIESYKSDFEKNNKDEIYKWKAIKCFQDKWDATAVDFYKMLDASFKLSANLIGSGNYFPLRMLLHYAEVEPNETRRLLIALFDEEQDLYSRMNDFKRGINVIHNKHFAGAKNSYQDHRALLVYLTLKYPDRYFFYKFVMFKDASAKLQLDYRPISGRIENVGYYNQLCEQIRYELSSDQELIKMHKDRITTECYYDTNFNILSQDFIFYVSWDDKQKVIPQKTPVLVDDIIQLNSSNLSSTSTPISFIGSKTNFLQNSIDNKRIGDLGEQWVLNYEKYKLINANLVRLVPSIIYSATKEGDGTGFDIQSFDEQGKKIFIEVKTTTGPKENPLFITRNELERSKIENDKYFLYRVYNFNEELNTANLLIIRGDLTNLCNNPQLFKVNLNGFKCEVYSD